MSKTVSASADNPANIPALCLAITEHAPLPMAMVEGATRIIRYANPAFCTLMKRPKGELVGTPLVELLPNKDQCLALIERVAFSKRPESYTEQDPSKPHPVFWSYTIWPMLENEGLVGIMIQVTETSQGHGMAVALNEALVLGSLRQHELTQAATSLNLQLQAEIVERQKVTDALRESESRFRILFDSSPMGVFVCNQEGAIQHHNARAVELWGCEPAFWFQQRCSSVKLWYPEGSPLPEVEGPMAQVLRTGRPVLDVEMYIDRPDGTRLPLLVNFAALTDSQGLVVGAITSCIDISERKMAEALREALLLNERSARLRVEDAGRMKDEFLATLSHELRSPLSAIFGWAEILRELPSDPTDLEKGLRIIERSAKAQSILIDDMLDISRIVSGKLRLDINRVDISDVVHTALAIVAPLAEAKSIALSLECETDLPRVQGDSARLQQVFWNLFSNAVKFTPIGGKVHLTVRSVDGWINIRIMDNGEGISEKFLPFVFERFRQADGSTSRRQGGLGLGLAICKNLVEVHAGRITAESEGAGKGATFVVELPAIVSASTEGIVAAAPVNSQSIRLDGIEILVIDDDAISAELLSRLLRKHYATVDVVPSADAALALLDHKSFDLLISDIGMPGKDGYEFLQELRASRLGNRNAPAIAVTAFARPEDRARALAAGFNVHISKPITAVELLRTVSSLMFD